VYKLQTPENYQKESTKHLEHGESLKSRISDLLFEVSQVSAPYKAVTLMQHSTNFFFKYKWNFLVNRLFFFRNAAFDKPILYLISCIHLASFVVNLQGNVAVRFTCFVRLKVRAFPGVEMGDNFNTAV
jgi:hypothetical protein